MRAALILPITLVACAPVLSKRVAGDPNNRLKYDCDNGSTINSTASDRSATISLDDGTNIRLDRIDTPSDARRYSDGGYVWFVDGDDAVLTERGGQLNCRVSAL